jgi:hypothetical protein
MKKEISDVLLLAMYADGTVLPLRKKFSGIEGQRLDADPIEVVIVRRGSLSEETLMEQCKVYVGIEPLDMIAGMQKYPEYYL